MFVHHFVSYSRRDGEAKVARLSKALRDRRAPVDLWIDSERLQPGFDWQVDLQQALRECRTLLYVMTTDSVGQHSVCLNEVSQALAQQAPRDPPAVRRGSSGTAAAEQSPACRQARSGRKMNWRRT